MRVRMLVDVSGTRDGAAWPPRGAVVDLPDAEAVAYCESGMAAPLAEAAPVETAVVPADEERRQGGLTTENVPSPARRSRR